MQEKTTGHWVARVQRCVGWRQSNESSLPEANTFARVDRTPLTAYAAVSSPCQPWQGR